MNPLSALSYLTAPQISGAGAAPKLAEELAGKPIPLQELASVQPDRPLSNTTPIGAGGNSFSNLLGQMVQEVGAKQNAAGDAVNGLLSGGKVSLHQAMIAMEEANVSFQLMVEVRNKLLESYQELMRMQI